MINIVIPMAGRGFRFKDSDHEEPKPLIKVVDGKPMVQLVVENLTPREEHRFIFICRREHDEIYHLDNLFGKITTRYEKVLVDEVTEGPACSVLLARPWIDNDQPMMTACADDFVDTDITEFLEFATGNAAEGTIMTYLANRPSGSSAKINDEGLVTEVAEKQVIGPYTTVGIYYFAKGRYFVEATEQMIRLDKRTNGEFYVAPVFNELIARGFTIKPYEIDAADKHCMGTPESLETFQRNIQSNPDIIS
ncbi:MAG: glycosyltransferase family 2 protein [Verrucomicrobiae bacterium]|nr:glycosyltransferase family 2 protein [Verrucomicrobiae bacterium]